MLFPTNFFDAWQTYSKVRRQRKAHRQTVDAVRELSPQILRDIGWPNAYQGKEDHRAW